MTTKQQIIFTVLIMAGAGMIVIPVALEDGTLFTWQGLLMLVGILLIGLTAHYDGQREEREKWERKMMKVENPLASFTASPKCRWNVYGC